MILNHQSISKRLKAISAQAKKNQIQNVQDSKFENLKFNFNFKQKIFVQIIVVFAIIAAAFAAPPTEPKRSERAVVYSNNLVGAPLAYTAGYTAPLAYSGVYSGVPAVSAYSAYPYAATNVYSGAYPTAYTYPYAY